MNTYLSNFFQEKKISYQMFEITDANNMVHFIDTDYIIGAIHAAPLNEQQVISQTLSKIDFYDQSVTDYLKWLGEILVKKFETAGQKTTV